MGWAFHAQKLTCRGKKLIIKLSREHVSQLIEEASRRHPIEACGGIFGIVKEDVAHVIKIVPLKNILESEVMFQIDPEEFLRVLLDLERDGLQHLGFFHSHHGATKPSAIDLKYMALWPGSMWIIVSSLNHDIAAYQIINGRLHEVHISIE